MLTHIVIHAIMTHDIIFWEVKMSDQTNTISTSIINLPPIPTEVEVQWDAEVHECRRAVERTNVWWTSIKKLNNIA